MKFLIQWLNLKRPLEIFKETFGFSPAVSVSAVALIVVILLAAIAYSIHSAPPTTLTIVSGLKGSVFDDRAEKYREILHRHGVKLNIITTGGSVENLRRLSDPSSHADVGFVQGGVTGKLKTDNLVSLGSVFYQPLFIFYRSPKPIELLSELSGKRLAIGMKSTGVHTLAEELLKRNGIEPGGATQLIEHPVNEETQAFLDGKVDAVFLMGDSARIDVLRKLLLAPDIRLYEFSQAEAYTRRITYLSKLELPKGGIDFGKDIPPHDLALIGPTVELIARENLHPALSDLLLEAAEEIHGGVTLLQRRGEFPSPQEREYRISADANRYYASGKSFMYRHLPFWMASMVNRIIAVIVPVFVLVVPGLKLIIWVYNWRVRSRIIGWYRAMQHLEGELLGEFDAEKRDAMLKRLCHIEKSVNKMKVPASFADQFYGLRGHIDFVQKQLGNNVSGHATETKSA